MYETDFMSATMSDVITRSFVCHPSLFRDTLLSASRAHLKASQRMADSTAARIARKMAERLRKLAAKVDADEFDAGTLTMAETVQSFAEAARLQCLSPAVRAHIAGKEGIPKA